MTIIDTNDAENLAPDWEAQLSDVFKQRFGLVDTEPEPDAVSIDAGPDDDLTPEEQAERVIGTEPRVEVPVEEPADEEDALPEVLRVPIPGSDQTFDLDTATAQQLLGLAAWSENLSPQTREQFAAIEHGAAVAVDRAEFERFRAWQQTNAADDLDDDLDPRVAQRIAALEAEVRQSRAQPQVQQHNARAEFATNAFASTAQVYATERGLSEAEMADIFNYAVNAQVIPQIAESMRTYSPTGQLVIDADYHEVARRAFDFALVSNPNYRQRAFAQAAPSGSPEPDPTAIKKARAGSLSSAPSAAVSTPPRDPRTMNPSELRTAMADELRAAMSGTA
jgi:hypothetical protein